MKFSASRVTAVFLLAAACATGCGDGRPMSKISGTVTFKDGNAPKAAVKVIRFEPLDDSDAVVRKAASASIAEDGSFELYTRKPGDGVHNGQYAVTFSVLDSPIEQNSLIKDEYTAIGTTPYTVDVQDDQTDLTYEIEAK